MQKVIKPRWSVQLAISALLALVLCSIAAAPVNAQSLAETPTTASVVETDSAPAVAMHTIEARAGSFHKTVVKAAIKAQQEGQITRLELMRIRMAMLSPALRMKAEEVAIMQIVASAEESIPFRYDEDGNLIREAIDWEGLIGFIERLIPIILMLVKIFGGL